jgi:hypothetical protein
MDRFRVDSVWLGYKKRYIVMDYRTCEDVAGPYADRRQAQAVADGYNALKAPQLRPKSDRRKS